LLGSWLPLGNTHLSARPHCHLSRQHDAFASSDTRANRDIGALKLTEHYRPKFGRVVRLHHVHEWTFLADLRGLIGN
jgi:hypothetical protein